MADSIIDEVMKIVELTGGSGSPATVVDALELLRVQIEKLLDETKAQGAE